MTHRDAEGGAVWKADAGHALAVGFDKQNKGLQTEEQVSQQPLPCAPVQQSGIGSHTGG